MGTYVSISGEVHVRDPDPYPEAEFSDATAVAALNGGSAHGRAATHLEVSINGGDLEQVQQIALDLLALLAPPDAVDEHVPPGPHPYIVVNTTDNEYLAKTADVDGSWTSTDDLDTARTFDTAERAEWAKPDDNDETTWEVRPLDLTVRLRAIVQGIDGYTDDESHLNALLATDDAGINAEPFLLVERSTRDDRYWLTLHESPAAAGDYDYQDDGDWEVEEVIDVRDGSRWKLRATFTAVPVT